MINGLELTPPLKWMTASFRNGRSNSLIKRRGGRSTPRGCVWRITDLCHKSAIRHTQVREEPGFGQK